MITRMEAHIFGRGSALEVEGVFVQTQHSHPLFINLLPKLLVTVLVSFVPRFWTHSVSYPLRFKSGKKDATV